MRKALLFVLLAGLALPGLAESTRFWRQSSYPEFDKGTATGVALRSDGELLLAPRSQELADPNLEYLWAIAEGPQGTLYLGGGSPAKVVALGAAGETRTVFESKELEVHALASDPKSGALYLATSPDGKVYKIPRGGEAAVLFDPGTKYLWDLVRAPDGALYLATGDKGEIFRIAPDGKGEKFFSSEETHIRALALDAAGNLYAGTEPNGLVLRLSPRGEAFVLYETPRKEVTALRFDSTGNLYVAAIGLKAKAPAVPGMQPGQQVPPQQVSSGSVSVTLTPTGAQQPVPTPMMPFLAAGGSDIYRIAPDGYPERVWWSPAELVYSLAFDAQSRLLAGTGNEGKLLAVDSPTRFTYLHKAASRQITALARAANGRVYLGTSNPGKLIALGPELEAEGSFESDVFDAELFSQWGRVSWQSRAANADSSVQLFTRSGNTSNPEHNWSPWAGPYSDAAGTPVSSPAARFLQWKAVLRQTDSRTPGLSAVAVAYLRRNVAPTVEKVIVQAPGLAVRGIPLPPQMTQAARLELPPPPARQGGGPGVQGQPPQGQQRFEPPPQGASEPGARSVIWSADDSNDDDLRFSVFYRGESETRWKLMKAELTEKFYTWDAATLPDGAYTVKVAASDAPSNPADLALTGENVSDRFEVDNTPPRLEGPTTEARSRTVEVRFTARDSYSPLKKAEYSLDAGEWQALFPVSRTTDAREHNYVFRLENLEAGEHTVVVRVYDQFDNPALAQVIFTVK